MHRESHPDTQVLRLVRWLSRYALRRRAALAAVVATLVLKTILDVFKPWPMLVLVDHILGGKALPGAVHRALYALPGGGDRDVLLAWTIGSTIVLFLLSWAL